MNTQLEKNVSVSTETALLFWESRVAESLGVPRKLLAKLRTDNLKVEVDFVRRENNAVALTAAGLQKIDGLVRALAESADGDLRAENRGKTGGKPAPDKKADVPAGPPKREVVRVQTVSQFNTKILLCETHKRAAAILIAVRVRENVNFTPGMELEAIESHDGVWQFRNRPTGDESTVGRLPRGKGKW